MVIWMQIKTLSPENANSRDRSEKGCIAVRAVKGCRMRVENVCGPAPAGGTRRHHDADAQLSGTGAQHPSQPVPDRRRMCVKQTSPRTRTAKTSLPYANKASSLTAAQQRHNKSQRKPTKSGRDYYQQPPLIRKNSYLRIIVLFIAGFSGMRITHTLLWGNPNLPNAPGSAGDKACFRSLCENEGPENRDAVRR